MNPLSFQVRVSSSENPNSRRISTVCCPNTGDADASRGVSLKLANGPYPEDPTAAQVLKKGTNFCFGTPDKCIKFFEEYEAMGIEQVFLLSAIGPATHEEVMNTIRLFGKYVIPHFKEKEKSQAGAAAANY